MTLFNSQDPGVAAAHAKVIDTLANIETEYGAVFLVDSYQQELKNALAAHHRRNEEATRAAAIAVHAQTLASRSRRPKHRAVVVDLTGKRVA